MFHLHDTEFVRKRTSSPWQNRGKYQIPDSITNPTFQTRRYGYFPTSASLALWSSPGNWPHALWDSCGTVCNTWRCPKMEIPLKSSILIGCTINHPAIGKSPWKPWESSAGRFFRSGNGSRPPFSCGVSGRVKPPGKPFDATAPWWRMTTSSDPGLGRWASPLIPCEWWNLVGF